MEQSILKSTKKILGVGDDDTTFDQDIITHINTEFSTLNDLGIGAQGGFVIEDDESEWAEFFPNEDDPEILKVQLSKVRACVWMRARLLFDPPTSAYHLDALKEQLREQEWRLNTQREDSEWVDPAPPTVLVVDGGDPTGVLDGGDPTGG